MRASSLLCLVTLAACGSDVDPRVIAGGGIGDGDIDGKLYVSVIDGNTDAIITGATVEVAGAPSTTTDADGFATFSDLSGKQTITVKASGYRTAVWVGANGTNITVPLTVDSATTESATLSGTIANWDAITVPAMHYKAAFVLYSQTDDLGDPRNDLKTPNNLNICGVGQQTCSWSVVTRTGSVSLVAMIVDGDPMGTVPADDDVLTVIGWATRTGITVESGVNQTGLVLDQVEAGNLQDVTIDYGTPPAALTDHAAIVGIEVSADELVQMPLIVTDKTKVLAPKPSVFAADAQYRLTAVAQTASGDQGAQSIVLRRHQDGPALAADKWLTPPTGVNATRDTAAFGSVEGARIYSVQYLDTLGRNVLELTVFDDTRSVTIPASVTLPSGQLTVRAQAIAADIDVSDFSLDADKDKLWGVAVQPTTIN